MSWDVLLLRVPEGVTAVDALAVDFVPDPVGALDAVVGLLGQWIPGVDLSDPSWGQLEGPGWSIELSIGDEDPVDSVMLHVRGGGDDVLPVVIRIARVLECGALDISTGDFLVEGATEGWNAFQQYRDRVLGGPGQ